MCSLSSWINLHQLKKLVSRLHGLGYWGHWDNINCNPLLFIIHKLFGIQFLIYTGATCSIYASSQIDLQKVAAFSSAYQILPTISEGTLTVLETFSAAIDLGISRLFFFQFFVSELTVL